MCPSFLQGVPLDSGMNSTNPCNPILNKMFNYPTNDILKSMSMENQLNIVKPSPIDPSFNMKLPLSTPNTIQQEYIKALSQLFLGNINKYISPSMM